ncbi:MAG TPA: PKD domain-containing protein, partial [Lacipirellulaceae bacterium]|nr:PKD domain-containing protein [Lacipirellulaceae bacterium]
IIVDNVPPTLVLTTEQFEINEGDTLTIPLLGTFSDPGFDNPANAGNAANGGEVAETFTYIIDWGDGTVESFTMPATRISGGPGVPTTGTLAGEHRYLDNDEDNKYTITVTLMDDDGGVAVGSFEITVWNVNPTLKPVSATDVNAFGQTTLTLEFSDPGADEFEILVDWGDKLHLPPDQRFVVAAVHTGPTPTTFVLTHTYAGPPDPLDPAADIKISVKIRDDDFGTPGVLAIGESNLEFAVITNPGEGNKFVRIDLSPRVPMLTFPVRPISPPALPGAKAVVESSSLGELQGSSGEALASSERFFELRIVDAQGDDVLPGYRLPPDVLDNLPALFRRLPDNTYRIYLVQGDSTSVAQVDRLVIEVVVRNGRMIDPGDDAEGARDRPPTDEAPAPNIDLPAADAPADQGARFDGPRPDSAASREPLTVGLLRRGSTLAAAARTLSAAGRASQAQLDAQQRPAEQRRRPLKSARHWRPRKPR